MIKLQNPTLSDRTNGALKEYQEEIDLIREYDLKVDIAKSSFSRRNRDNNHAFREVRRVLDAMCSGNRRCCYCEDSCADEVEHIQPKDLYPELTFVWINYLYACGSCNGPKRNKFAVIDRQNQLVVVTRGMHDPVIPPHPGRPAVINPRSENPLEFIELDISETFMFVLIDELNNIEYARADYTITVLSLNIREVLVQGRKNAYGSYKARLNEYADKKEANSSDGDLLKLQEGILTMGQPTVWE